MAPTKISPDRFREEAGRRLIDTFDLMLLLGLRSKEGVRKRVESGKVPPPVLSTRTTTLWDRDAIPGLDGDTETPDRKED